MEKYQEIFRALSNEVRIDLLRRGITEKLTSDGVIDDYCVESSTANYHLRRLYKCGLMTYVKDGLYTRYSTKIEVLRKYLPAFAKELEGSI